MALPPVPQPAPDISGGARLCFALRTKALWLALLWLLAGVPISSGATVVRVGVYQNSPKIDFIPGRPPEGIFIDVLEAIAQREAWTLEYVPGTFSEGLARLAAGHIDLMPDVARTSERERLYAFHDEPVLSSWNQVYARRGSGIRSVVDLSGKRIAVLQGSMQQDYLQQTVAAFGMRAELLTLPDFASAFQAVAQGRADAVATNRFYGARHAAASDLEDTSIIFNPSRLYFAARLDRNAALLTAIDKNLIALRADPDSAYFKSLRRWTDSETRTVWPVWLKWGMPVAAVLLLASMGWAVTLRRTADRLRNSERRQRELAAELGRIFERSQDVIFVLDAELRFVRVSDAAYRLWGWVPTALIGRDYLSLVVEDERLKIREKLLMQPMDRDEAMLEARTRHIDGSEVFIVWSAVWSAKDQLWYCIARDDTERRDLLTELKRRAGALERSALELTEANRALEAFNYSVSHDLRAPLAAISGFGTLLLQRNADKLDTSAQAMLQRVLVNVGRMGRLIDDLLNLARVSRQPIDAVDCDLSEIAAGVMQSLRQAQPQRRVQFELAPELRVRGDPGLLRIMLENLLGNAWKFTEHAEDACIQMGREPCDDGMCVFVRDNGAGFDMRHASKLFEPFHRMHGAEEFDGTGIGLSIVHRIVARHNGRVWAEAAPGRGATIRFTLGQ